MENEIFLKGQTSRMQRIDPIQLGPGFAIASSAIRYIDPSGTISIVEENGSDHRIQISLNPNGQTDIHVSEHCKWKRMYIKILLMLGLLMILH